VLTLDVGGLNIGLAGYGMGVKIKAGYGMTALLMAGYGIKIFWRERDLLIFDRRDTG